MRTVGLLLLSSISLAALNARAAAAQGDTTMSQQDSIEIARLPATNAAAAGGDAAAQCRLAFAYLKGTGVPQDYAEAARWFRKAAEQGVAAAQFPLGMMLFTGSGVPKNTREAAAWYRRAADQGHGSAQYYLGVLYDGGGGGLTDDIVQAYVWVALAARHPAGENFSEPLRARAQALTLDLQSRMTKEQFADAERQVERLVPAKP